MNNQFSDLWSINKKEALIGLAVVVASAIVDLIVTGINTVIDSYEVTKVLDFTMFTAKVNLQSLWSTVSVTTVAYFGIVFSNGKKKA